MKTSTCFSVFPRSSIIKNNNYQCYECSWISGRGVQWIPWNGMEWNRGVNLGCGMEWNGMEWNRSFAMELEWKWNQKTHGIHGMKFSTEKIP